MNARFVKQTSHSIASFRTHQLAVAKETGCSGYDSQYIALAQDLGLNLYTYDRKILASVPSIASEPKFEIE